MKIYTKTGDDGTTGLFGGKRLPKDDIQIEAYGTVDELNAFLGLLGDQLDSKPQQYLRRIQSLLFNIGAHLATASGKKSPVNLPSDEDLREMEIEIDRMEASLPSLKNFILPGGHQTISHAHISRTICRRAERRVISLSDQVSIDPKVIVYLNRLSDYLFVLARYTARDLDVREVLWQP